MNTAASAIARNTPTADTARSAAVPGGRLARLARLGSLATGVAGGMLAEGARQLAAGKRPKVSELVLTPANARRVADQLAQLRGAAMKVGQLMSMDAGNLLPPELADILARLREDARTMPMSQVVEVLETHWGKGWELGFERFSFTPCAAASIGQVHRARTRDGQELAIKLQYPGVRRSIDSDVDNVATLLRVSGLLPKSLDLAPLLDEAKRQLHEEADYRREAENLHRFGALLEGTSDFVLPRAVDALTRSDILAMSWVEGVAVESLADPLVADQALRDRVAGLLIGLLFRELFEFRLIQTDPNFANYRFDADSGRLVLLDFGATRAYAGAVVEAYRRLMAGTIRGDRAAMGEAAQAIGYFQDSIHAHQREAVIDLFEIACEPLRHPGPYDFGASDLAVRLRDAGLALSTDRDFWHTPPADALFLHRKLGGLYLLAARLGARVDVGAQVARWLD
ncbi:MAG: ABC1 kinase family protein [Thauera sp.]